MQFDTLPGWLKWQENFHPRTIDLGLERATRVYRAINPSANRPFTITVAGTNGKGSCIAFMEAILRAAGYRVGAYTSPHMIDYNERIKIDGVPVSDDMICSAFEHIESVRKDISLSYFEFGTLAALDIFSRADLDVQLLEVGLGGRLDAVNIVDTDIALITSICIDHCDWLGETREAIGCEKAGIYRSGAPAVVGDSNPPDSLLECAEAGGVPIYFIGKDFTFNRVENGWNWSDTDKRMADLPWPALQGEHQFANAASVIKVINLISDSLPVGDDSVRQGLRDVRLSGRFQYVEGDTPVLLDVGHNPLAARVLVTYLKQSFPKKRIHAVFSMMKDKDIKGVVETMKPVIYDWYLSPLKNPRTASEEVMIESFNSCEVENIYYGYADFTEAFMAAGKNACSQDLIVIFGSFFLVSEFLLGQKH